LSKHSRPGSFLVWSVLMPGVPQGTPLESVQAFRQGLQALGYIHGQNMLLEERWNERGPEHWPVVVAEVLRSGLDVLVSGSGAATRTVAETASTVSAREPHPQLPGGGWLRGKPLASGRHRHRAHDVHGRN
jgi:hypothetical protein